MIKSDYKPVFETIKGHGGGYVSRKDIDFTNMRPENVIDCRNIDCKKGVDKPREPYDLYSDLSTKLPSGYEILRFTEKQFTDGDGNDRRVMIVTAKNIALDARTNSIKIFISSNYVPESNYDNAWKSGTYTPGFTDDFIELTARYKAGEENFQFEVAPIGLPYEVNGQTYQLRNAQTSKEAVFSHERNYFRGWYVIQGLEVVGIITESVSTYSAGVYTATYFKIVLEQGAVLTNQNTGICRFPVNQLNIDGDTGANTWEAIEDIKFETGFTNTVNMFCGNDSEPLQLSFITKRKSFTGSYSGHVIYVPEPHPSGEWLSVQGIPTFTGSKNFIVKCIGVIPYVGPIGISYIQFAWSTDGVNFNNMPNIAMPLSYSFDVIQDLTLGMQVRLKSSDIRGFDVGDYASFNIIPGMAAAWDGFWFGFMAPQVIQKKLYKYIDGNMSPNLHVLKREHIGRQLGIRYEMSTADATRPSKFHKIYSLAVELNGTEAIFVKNIFLGHTPVSGKDDFLNIDIFFEPWFDRRLTAHMLYYHEAETIDHVGSDSAEYILPETFRFNDIKRGYYQIAAMGASKVNNAWKVVLMNTIDIKLVDSASSQTSVKLSVDTLNGYYHKSINQKAKYGIRVGDNIIAIHLSNENVNVDKDTSQSKAGNGAEMICVSQYQRGINATSIMSTERTRQITKGYPLTGGAWMTENQFILFTGFEVKWYDITDEATLALRNVSTFDKDGLAYKRQGNTIIYNEDCYCEAREILSSQAGPLTVPLSSLFRGVFFAGNKSIYEVVKNRPVNLLAQEDENGRIVDSAWMVEYSQLQDKHLIRAGYRSNQNQVFFSIPELNQIRVWSRDEQNWTIYEFPDTVKYFVQEMDGELFFHTGNKIYKTEPSGTSKKKDKESETPADIPLMFEQYINFKDSQVMKVLQELEMTYEIDANAAVNLEVGTTTNENDVFDDVITLRDDTDPEKFYDKQGFSFQTRGQWHRIKMWSTTSLQGFRLLLMKLKATPVAGNITRE